MLEGAEGEVLTQLVGPQTIQAPRAGQAASAAATARPAPQVRIEDEDEAINAPHANTAAERFDRLLGSWTRDECIAVMEQAQLTHVYTERAIPKACRAPAQLLWSQLNEARDALKEDLRPHACLFLFPRIFASIKRGGRAHNKERFYMARLELATAGKWDELLQDIKAVPRKVSDKDDLERAEAMVREGDLSGAARVLTSYGVAPVNEDTFEKLKEKHPEGEPIDVPRALPPPVRVTVKNVEDALNSFKKGSATGPSGARADLFKWLLQGADGKTMARSLTGFANDMLGGTFPAQTAPFWAGAVLVALRKDKEGSDVRPIAVGEVLRRLVGKAALLAIGTKGRDILLPLQVAVKVNAGAEGVVRAAQLYLGAHWDKRDRAELNVDIKNAFNAIDRGHVLRAVAEKLPELAAFAYYCYATPSHLIYGHSIIFSTSGVQQGDPLGTLLFCLGLDDTLRAVKEAYPTIDFMAFFADDGTLGGPTQSLSGAFKRFKRLAARIGLVVNTAKCAVMPTLRIELNSANFSEEHINLHFDDLRALFPGVPIVASLKTLGVPITHYEEAVRQHLLAERDSIRSFVDRVTDFDDAQIAYIILRFCGPLSRATFTARVAGMTARGMYKDMFRQLDAMTRTTLETILGQTISDDNWAAAQLRVCDGGLGLDSLELHFNAAWLGSYFQTRELVEAILPDAPEDPIARRRMNWYNDKVLRCDQIDPANPVAASQRILSERINKKRLLDYKDKTRDNFNKTHMTAVASPHANDWLNVMAPKWSDGTLLTSSEFVVAVKDHLNIDGRGGLTHCPLKHHREGRVVQVALDYNTTHHKGCAVGNGTRDRSTMIERTLGDLETLAGRRVDYQPQGLFASRQVRPDLLVVAPEGGRLAIDVAVTSSVQTNILSRSAARAGVAAAEMEMKKINHYKPLPDNLRFQPLVVETLGAWGPSSLDYLKSLAAAISLRLHAKRSWAVSQVFTRLSCALQRGNARMILERQRPVD